MIDAITLPIAAHGEARVKPGSRLNVRTEPSPTAPVRGQLMPGELVTVWALDDGWAIVQNVAGLTGWAAAEYLEIGALIP
jgi:uncharacterized protein YraI